MPKVKKKTTHAYTRNHTKRRGLHHKQSRSYVKAYAPYLPLVISIITSIFISMWQPRGGVTLAYATNTSIAGLLQSTNAQRATNARAALSNNSQLNQAAQAKAQDMVARDYWSHDTPDGKEPWVFIQNAGYKYAKAGENLAYGFATSSETVTGWMNSASHRANLLDAGFTQVGFGFANSKDFNGDGKQTVVVAMYGRPLTSTTGSTTTGNTSTQPKTTPQQTLPKTQQNTTQTPSEQDTPPPTTKTKEREDTATPLSSEVINTGGGTASGQQISKIDTMTGGNAPWALGAVITGIMAITVLGLLRHSLKLRHLIKDIRHGTEKYILHRPLLDSTLLGLLILGIVLAQTRGFIL